MEEEPEEQEKTYKLEEKTEAKEEQETVKKTISYQWTLIDKDQNITRFDANGTMVSQEDANGNFLLYEMDETGLLKTVTTDKNQSLKMQYNDQNLLKEIELADGTKMQYTYDTAGDLTNAAHVSADGTQSVQEPYAYDKEHHMTADRKSVV